jgi:uncharacterized membrane protein YeaQ/YmgE (transglycosylase-associated protein family)
MGWAIIIIWVAIPAAVGPWIGLRVKGRPLTGFLLGIFLGWIGVLITALLPPTAEMRVRNRIRDAGVAEEADRRRAGAEPWSRDLDPPVRKQQPQS